MPYERCESPERREELEARRPRVEDHEELLNGVPPEKVEPGGGIKHSHFSHLEMSVDRASLTSAADTCARRGGNVAVACAVTHDCRLLNFVVAPDPMEDPPDLPNPAHALIYGEKSRKPIQKALSLKFRIVHRPPGFAMGGDEPGQMDLPIGG